MNQPRRTPPTEGPPIQFKPGLRFSVTDGLILAAGTIGAWLLRASFSWLALVILYVVGHFFLFCNVFRISRRLELAWAAVFIICATAAAHSYDPGWLHAFSPLPMTVLVIGIGLRQPSYHGVFWQWVNPRLLDWWAARQDTRTGPEDR